MGAVTDSLTTVTYEPVKRPAVANLLEILSQCIPGNPTPASLASDLAGENLGSFKRRVVEAVTRELEGIRDRYEEALQRTGGKYLDDIQALGAQKARENAADTMRRIRDAVGLSAS